MAVWLTHGPCTVGLDDGLIRAADFARLVDSSEVAATVEAHRTQVLAEANRDAARLLETARREAADLTTQAQARFDAAHDDGFQQGLQEATFAWTDQQLDAAQARRHQLLRQSERLSSIVSMAVERVIEQEDRSGLYRRSLREVVKLVREAPMLTLRVPDEDLDDASRAVQAIMAQLSTLPPIEVVIDSGLPEGGCRFESDAGVIDASLDTQLTALRRAINRAAEQMAEELASVELGDPAQESLIDLHEPAPSRCGLDDDDERDGSGGGGRGDDARRPDAARSPADPPQHVLAACRDA